MGYNSRIREDYLCDYYLILETSLISIECLNDILYLQS